MAVFIFATHNDHKLEEVQTMLSSSGIDIVSLKDKDFHEDIEETGSTMDANALIKSRTIYNAFHQPVFSDDSGLEVMALDMEPGVHTARYAGPEKDSEANMSKLLDRMKGIEDRRAQFRAVVALIWDGEEYLFEGVVKGRIAQEKKGDGGFGYDPIFIPDGFDESFAELGSELKNGMSHRFRAIDKMRRFLETKKAD